MARTRDDDDRDDNRRSRRDDDRGRDRDEDRGSRSRDRDRDDDRDRRSRDDDRDTRSRDRDRDDDRDRGRSRDRDDDRRGSSRDRDADRGSSRDATRNDLDSRRREREYIPRTAEEVQRHATQSTGSYDTLWDEKYKAFKAREGLNAVRFIPGTFGDKRSPVYPYWRHENIGPDNSSYVCLDKTLNQACPICEQRGNFSDEDANELRPRKRWLGWVIDRDAEREGPQLWDISPTADKNISGLLIDRLGRVVHMDDPDNGFDLEFMREGQRLNTRYSGYKISRDSSPLSDDPDKYDRWWDYAEDNPLDKVLIIHEREYLEKVFSGQAERMDKDLDKEPEDRRRRPRERMSRDRDEEPKGRSLRDELDDKIPDKGDPREERRPRERLDDRKDDDRDSRRSRDDDRDNRSRDRDRDRDDDRARGETRGPGSARDDEPDRERDKDEEEDVSANTRDKLRDMSERRSSNRDRDNDRRR